MKWKKTALACCAVLLCTSLVLAHTKPARTTGVAKPEMLESHSPITTTVLAPNTRAVLRPTNSLEQALEALQRAEQRGALKGARAVGDDCTQPIAVTLAGADLPYVTSDTTCGRYDDYEETCLGYYDGGEDIIYELTFTEDLDLGISVSGSTWVGVALDTVCPPGATCLAYATDSGGQPSMTVSVTAGTYYLMVDTWPSPECTDFTLTIQGPCQVTCPPGASLEGEPDCGPDYDDTYNGGCNSTVPVFSTISCGETVCGAAGTFLFGGSNYRDTDWYEIDITEETQLVWTAKAEFPVLIFIIDAGSGDCVDYVILGDATGNPCDEISLSKLVAPGTYWLWIGPSVFEGVPCSGVGSNYVATVACEEPPPCDPDYEVAAPGSWSGSTCGADDDCDLRAGEEHMYKVAIPNDGMWVFSLCDSSYDTYMFVGTTCCGQQIGYNDDACGAQSELIAYVTAGTYWVDIEGYSGCGDYVLDVSELIGPDNDFCQNATDAGTLVDGVPVVITGDNTGATEDCSYLSYGAYGDAWIMFTIAEPCMDVSVAYCGTSPAFDNGYIVMDQYCPCSGSFIYAVDWNNTDCGDGNYTMFWEELSAGTYYWPILTDSSYWNAEGPYTITITGNTCEVCDIVCDPEATPEGEPICGPNYEDTFNGGCNSLPAVFSPITCGETVCGTSGTYLYFGSSYRDTDWFEFTLYQPATVTWEVIAEFDLLIFLMDAGSGNCIDYAILGSATADDCETATLTFDVDPGTYWAWVGPSVFDGVPCGAEYEGTLITDPPDACTPVGACCLPDCNCVIASEADCEAQDGAYQGDDTECAEPPPPPPPQCTDPDATVTITILTDPYPSETTWELIENGWGVVATGGPYSSSYTTYVTDVDVCSTSCYTFNIYDSYGDGIYSPGGYEVAYEGGVVASTLGVGWSGSMQTVEDIGGGCGGGGVVEPCVDPDTMITVAILTDPYPSETTWQLVEVGVGVVAVGGPYSSSYTLYTTDVPACTTSCYEFTIFDAWGDGIYAPGGYEITYDGAIVASTMGSGWSGTEQTAPLFGGGCPGCQDPDATITIEIMTDLFGSETTWELIEVDVGVVAAGGPYSGSMLYTIDVPVCSTSCYQFVIYDSYGDGICCAYGYGYYNVYYEGELVGTGGVFGTVDTVDDIGAGCVPPLGACWVGWCGECVMTTDFCCDNCGGTFQGYGNSCEDAPPPICTELDIKPGSCPNSYNRGSHGVLPVALVGTEDFDVMDVDITSLQLWRADGVGSVAPHEGPPGPHTTYGDSATPFYGEGCECCEMGGDGIMDLNMKFKTDDVVPALQLNDLPAGALVELVVTGSLVDGTLFAAFDCIRLVPPGTPPGQLAITSNVPSAWIDVTPLDDQLDGGGFIAFERTYPVGTVVTLTAPETQGRRPFMIWVVNGVPQTPGDRDLDITVAEGVQTLDMVASYQRAVPQQVQPIGQQQQPKAPVQP